MTVGNYHFGVSYLPEDCLAYEDGYRFASFKKNLYKRSAVEITAFFRTVEEVRAFVNSNREYGKN